MTLLSTGGAPVTGVEVSVGLILDKSKGLALGVETIANGNFADSSTAGWTGFGGGSEWTVFNGYAQGVGVGSDNPIEYAYAFGPNKVFAATFNISNLTSGGSGTVEIIGGARLDISSDGNKTIYIVTAGAASGLQFRVTADTSFDLTNISVKEVAGNHARQTTQAVPTNNRPILSAKYNLLARTEEFGNATWTKASGALILSSNTEIAPNDTLTADVWNGTGYLQQSIASTGTFSISVYAKKGTTISNTFTFGGTGLGTIATFDISPSSPSATPGASGLTANISSAGNDWFLCTATFTASITSVRILGPGDGSIFVWGASLLIANQAAFIPYQRVVTTGNYDTDATKFPPYLRFDGTTSSELDALATINTIDFSGTDKVNATAGVRNTGTISATLYELTNNFSSTRSFGASCPSSGGTNTIRGYQNAVSSTATPTTAAPPNTFVANFAYNNSNSTVPAPQANVVGRINAGPPTSPTLNTGGGVFANDKLYIGARNEAGSFFNGNLFSLIIRGAESTPTQIANTETYVNSKTKAY
jgi:hypothetical protein